MALVVATQAVAAEPGFDVIKYDVALTPSFASQTVRGTERIHFKSLAEGLTVLDFSANNLDLHASLDGEAMVQVQTRDERRLFHLPYALGKGQIATLVITFSGKAPRGLIFDGDMVSANYFTCDYMVCDQDRTSDRAQMHFSLTLEAGMDSVAPGELQRKLPAGKGLQTWHWQTRNPRPAYLFGFAAGRLNRFSLDANRPVLDVLTSVADEQHVRRMFVDTRPMLEFFERKAQIRLPGRAYTQVLIKGSEAQEAASHAVIGLDEVTPILADPKEDWVIAHELAHQWWGNAVTCSDWSELWLNEGLAVFMVAAWKEKRWGREAYDREIELAGKRWQAAKDAGFDVPLSWPGKYPSLRLKRAMAYAKSVIFLDALRHELGEQVFWSAIGRYTVDNVNRSVTASDLQRAFEREAGRSLKPLFDKWVFGT